jgi:hypothetical protein
LCTDFLLPEWSLREWKKSDTRRINEMISTNKGTSDFKKMIKRVYKLYQVKGLTNMYTSTFIQPYHLLKLGDEEYNQLQLETRRLYFVKTSGMFN